MCQECERIQAQIAQQQGRIKTEESLIASLTATMQTLGDAERNGCLSLIDSRQNLVDYRLRSIASMQQTLDQCVECHRDRLSVDEQSVIDKFSLTTPGLQDFVLASADSRAARVAHLQALPADSPTELVQYFLTHDD